MVERKATNEPLSRLDKALVKTRFAGAYDISGSDFLIGFPTETTNNFPEFRVSPTPPNILVTDNFLQRTLGHCFGWDTANNVWRPLPLSKREDGLLALTVDTELALIGDVKVASLDGTAANDRFLRVDSDANNNNLFVTLRVGTLGITETTIGAKNALDVNIAGNGGANSVTFSAPTFATVGAASGLALAANANRRALYLYNTSAANTISLAWGANPAVLNSGITLQPLGTVILSLADVSTQALNAIASAGATNLAIQEGT